MLRRLTWAATIVAALLLPPATARADRGWAGLHFDVADLAGDFATQVGRNGYGLSGEGWLSIGRESPLALGLRGGFLVYGHESERVPLSPTIPGVWVDVDRDNNIVLGQLLLRLQAWQGDVRPYGEAFVGLNYLYTKTSVSSEDTGIEFAGSNNWDDTAFAWGAGGGLLLRVGKTKAGPIYVDVGATLVKGGRARYLAEGDVQVIDDRLTYFLHDSYTDYLLWRVGATFGFR
jgi:hypothetical protein